MLSSIAILLCLSWITLHCMAYAIPIVSTDVKKKLTSDLPFQNDRLMFSVMVDPLEKMAVLKLRHGGICFLTTFNRRLMIGNTMRKVDKVARILSKALITDIVSGKIGIFLSAVGGKKELNYHLKIDSQKLNY
ncbi:hypothetical protein TrispH2_008648 [Trichoplax sp. H2]|nr:hypothetical protein TrispH2_008648 [Trichoplax sp. H2]|eukprot:RDD38060.1 hypothetical protein TrispH2_008648 [Trichoplax sp. H2]